MLNKITPSYKFGLPLIYNTMDILLPKKKLKREDFPALSFPFIGKKYFKKKKKILQGSMNIFRY